ncbi:hypothetical protein BGZ65_009708, partial [Modicella reniformis]
MDFFAQTYNNSQHPEGSRTVHSPLQSPRSVHEGTCQGYGTEVNAHLRRASSGLESDVPRLQQLSPAPGHARGH